MSGLVQGLLKLVTTGLLCGGLLSLVGKSPGREILRFGCACLMVVFLGSLLRQTEFPAGLLSGYEARLWTQVAENQRNTRETLLEQIRQGLAEELRRQAAVLSLECDVSVECSADEDGAVTVSGAELVYRSGPRENLQALRQSVALQLALPTDLVTVREEIPS